MRTGRLLAAAALVLLAAIPSDGQPPARQAVIASEAIRAILAERVDTHHQGVGIVVGVIEPAGRRIVTYGRRANDDARPLDGDTIFEIGSITKVFTALLLADAVRRGEVAPTDPVAAYLPGAVRMPERGGRAITLRDLANHSSGLPRLPANLHPADPANPYADYGVDELYAFLSGYDLPRDAGTAFEYSNLGAGLLGHVLARRAGMDYETLVRTRITRPLGMTQTAVTLSPDARTRLAVGHDAALEPVGPWDLAALAGAGALRSTANDMLTFLSAAIGATASPLAGAMAAMTAERRPTDAGRVDVGLGWLIFRSPDGDVVFHNGATGGYRSFIGYNPATRAGVIVLANAMTPAGVDDIGRHLLSPASPLLPPDAPALRSQVSRTAVDVDPAVLDRYVGRYRLAPAVIVTITREGARLFAQLTGQQRFEVFAERETHFFYRVVDAQLTFEPGAPGGAAAAVTLHQNGADRRAPRIESEPALPAEIALDAAVLDRYVGRYRFPAGSVLTVTRQGTRLLAQMTDQRALEIVPSSEREFFYRVVEARLTFEVDRQGRATAVVLHQSGQDRRAARAD